MPIAVVADQEVPVFAKVVTHVPAQAEIVEVDGVKTYVGSWNQFQTEDGEIVMKPAETEVNVETFPALTVKLKDGEVKTVNVKHDKLAGSEELVGAKGAGAEFVNVVVV